SQFTPDNNVSSELNQATSAAYQSEQTTIADAPQSPDNAQPASPGAPPQPASIEVGQTVDDVLAIQGQPLTKANGANGKTIYVYLNLKVVFQDGRVVDVQ